MSDILEYLDELSEAYESGDYVDISAYNYFEMALDEIKRLEERIEELRQMLATDAIKQLQCPRHHITDKQLAAAVEWSNAFSPKGSAWGTLNKLGIERCPQASMDWHDRMECVTCNGRGWVVGGEGE